MSGQLKRITGALSLQLGRIEKILLIAAGTALVAMVGVMVYDAIARYLFDGGFQGTYRLVEMFLFPGAVFLALAVTQREGRNVAVDYFADQFPRKVQMIVGVLTPVVSLALVGVVTYGALKNTLNKWGNWTVEQPPLPVGASESLLLIGAAFLALRLFVQLVQATSVLFDRSADMDSASDADGGPS